MTTEQAAAPLAKKEGIAAIGLSNGIIQLKTYEDAYRYAASIQRSGLAPASFKTAEQILVAIQHGAELGFKPLQSLQHICVIQGRPAVYGKGLPALIMGKGVMEEFKEWFEGTGDNMTAFSQVKRKGVDERRVGKFSVAQAKKAGLWGKDNWNKYPEDMLMAKARARAFVLFADLLAGLPLAEDIEGLPPERREYTTAPDPLLSQAGIKTVDGQVIEGKPEGSGSEGNAAAGSRSAETELGVETPGVALDSKDLEKSKVTSAPDPNPKADLINALSDLLKRKLDSAIVEEARQIAGTERFQEALAECKCEVLDLPNLKAPGIKTLIQTLIENVKGE